MRIGIVGGTGKTGRRAVEHALRAGHAVRVLARGATTGLPAAVEVVRGDALDPLAVSRFVDGLNAVVCTLGPAPNAPPDVCSRAAAILIEAMREKKVSRLIVQTGAMIGHPRLGAFYRWMSSRPFNQRFLAERREQERLVRESGLDWTLVRPPRLTEGPGRGRTQVTEELEIHWNDQVSRDEVGRTLIEAAEGSWSGRGVAVVSRLGLARPGKVLRAWVLAMGLAELTGIGMVALVAATWMKLLGAAVERTPGL